ncbi:MAG: hypothetical protein R2780_05725 [Crocinitomicaceae bacterium]
MIIFTGTFGTGCDSPLQETITKLIIRVLKIANLEYICRMEKRLTSILTKIMLFIVLIVAVPTIGYTQDGGAKTVKSGRSKSRAKKIKQGKRSRKKSYKNQDKATRKRMKRAAKNAKRRQRGKPMKNNRLT